MAGTSEESDQGQFVYLYDKVFHNRAELTKAGNPQHVFVAHPSATRMLGLHDGSSASFVEMHTKGTWCNENAYFQRKGEKRRDGRPSRIQAYREGFAYSAFHNGSFLLALRFSRRRDCAIKGDCDAFEWFVVHVSCDDLRRGGRLHMREGKSGPSKQVAGDDYGYLLSHLRPNQRFCVEAQWYAESNTIEVCRLELVWSEVQKACWEQYRRCGLDEGSGPQSLKEAVVMMTGRAEAFACLGECPTAEAMLVQKRTFWKRAPLETSKPYAMRLTFAVVCRFEEEPSRLWMRKVQCICSPPVDSCLWTLEPDARVTGRFYQEWTQVDCEARHHAFVSVEADHIAAPVLVHSQAALDVETIDLFAPHLDVGGSPTNASRYWRQVWCHEDWRQYTVPEKLDRVAEVIDLDGPVPCRHNVPSVVTGTFKDLGGQHQYQVKFEIIKEALANEEMKASAEASREKRTSNPYAKACEKLRRKAVHTASSKENSAPSTLFNRKTEGKRVRSRSPREHTNRSITPIYKRSRPEEDVRGGDVRRSFRADRPSLPAPIAASRPRSRICVPTAGAPLRAQRPPAVHVLGDAALRPVVLNLSHLRYAIETFGKAYEGDELNYVSRLLSAVWGGRLLEAIAVANLEQKDMQFAAVDQALLASCTPEEVALVFHSCNPYPTRVVSPIDGTVRCIPLALESAERIAAYRLWMETMPDAPYHLIIRQCISELHPSFRNYNPIDATGHRQCLVREGDLVTCESRQDERDCFDKFKEAVDSMLDTMHMSSDSWKEATFLACSWAVHYMDTDRGNVNLSLLGDKFRQLNGYDSRVRLFFIACKEKLKSMRKQIPSCLTVHSSSCTSGRQAMRLEQPLPAWPSQ